jgi:hypothetical protein
MISSRWLGEKPSESSLRVALAPLMHALRYAVLTGS